MRFFRFLVIILCLLTKPLLNVEASGSIAGTVVDVEGNPIANIWVRAARSVNPPVNKGCYTTAIGTYVITDLPAKTYLVDCHPPAESGFLYQKKEGISVTDGQTTTVDFILLKEGQVLKLTLSGTVTDEEGNPVANARIEIFGPVNKFVYTTTAGTYTICDLIEGTYNIYCYPPEDSVLISQERKIYVLSGETTVVDFVLSIGGIITGRVTDELGNPIEWAYVSARGPTYGKAETDESGTYTICGLVEGIYKVYYLSYEPWWRQEQKANVQVVSGQTTTVDFIMSIPSPEPIGTGKIAGKVTDHRGNPIVHAEIVLYDLQGNRKSVYTVTTGTYMISDLAEGKYSVYAYPPEGSELVYQRKGNINIINDKTTIVDFVLPLGGEISGKVVDREGNPLVSAYVCAYGEDGLKRGSAHTIKSGTYTIRGLAEGIYTIYCDPPYDTGLLYQKKKDIKVVSGRITTVDFCLPLGGKISGKVIDLGGNPVAKAYVGANGPSYKYSYTAETGTYSISGLKDGIYKIYCDPTKNTELTSQQRSNVKVILGKTIVVDFVLPPGGKISGRVTDREDNPVVNAWIQVRGKSVYTTATGTYTICGLAEGKYYKVYCYPPKDSNLCKEWKIGISVIKDRTARVNFALSEGGKISGQVTNFQGRPVTHARVFAGSSSGSGTDYTESDGNYVISGLAEGIYTVRCYPPYASGLAEQSESDIRVISGETTTFDFVLLPRNACVTGKIYKEDAATIYPGVEVFVYPAYTEFIDYSTLASPVAQSVSDFEGNYVVSNLNSGSYDVYAVKRTDVIGYKSGVELAPGQVSQFDFVEQSGTGQIYGKVATQDNEPLSAYVWAVYSGNHKLAGRAFALTNGTYSITGLGPGNYQVFAQGVNLGLSRRASVNLTAGESEQVNFRFGLISLKVGDLEKSFNFKNGKINIPAASFDTDVNIIAIPNPSASEIELSDCALLAGQLLSELRSYCWEIKAVDSDGNEVQPEKEVTITLNYPAGLSKSLSEQLRIFTLENNSWILPSEPQSHNQVNRTIWINTMHLSYFRLLLSPEYRDKLDKIIVYPNPFCASNPQHQWIRFLGLTKQATIRIYTIAGELVKSIEKNDIFDYKDWDTRNKESQKVASGVYIWLIKNDQGKQKIGKLAIIRTVPD